MDRFVMKVTPTAQIPRGAVIVLAMFGLTGCQLPLSAFNPVAPEPVASVMGARLRRLPINAETVRGGATQTEEAARQQLNQEVLRYSSQPWIAAAPQPLQDSQRLPAAFYEPFLLNPSLDDTGLSLDMLALRISQVTRIPVRVLPDVYAGIEQSVTIDESEAVEAEEKLQADEARASVTGRRTVTKRARFEVQEIPPHLLRWRGNLRGFLNHLTDRLDLSWSYEDGTIVFSRFLTESFELALFPMRGSYSVNSTGRGQGGSRGGSSGGGSSSSSSGGGSGAATASAGSVNGSMNMNFSEEGQLDAYDSTLRMIESLIATVPGSKVFVTQGSGRVLVRSSRVMLRNIRELVRAENNSLTRQVMVQLDIYSVTNNAQRQFSVDWSMIQPRLFPGVDFSLKASPSEGGASLVKIPQSDVGTPRKLDTLISSFAALGYGVQHRPLNMLAMNRQWIRKSRLLSQSYLAETIPSTSNTLTGGTGVPGLRAGVVSVGDQIMVMPYVMENNAILLKIALSFSDLLGLDQIESGDGLTRQRIQIPRTSTSQESLTVQVKPGEVVAITGLGNNQNSALRKSLSTGLTTWLGGAENEEQKEQHFLVFLRVVLL